MNTPSIRRKPGRPSGSSRYRDSDPRLLQQVADKMLTNPALTTRAAVIQVLGKHDAAALRRLQTKVHPREQFLAEARERADAAERRRVEVMENAKLTVESIGVDLLYANRAAHEVVRNLANDPTIRTLAETAQRLHESGAYHRMAEMAGRFLNSPVMQEARQVHEAMRASGVLKQMEAMRKLLATEEVRSVQRLACAAERNRKAA